MTDVKTIIKFLLMDSGVRFFFYRSCMHFFYSRGWYWTSRYISNRLQRAYGVYLPPNTVMPRSVILRHPIGVVIGEGVVLGENVVIYQNVTLGGARVGDAKMMRYPTIGDNTVIFAGAVLLGKIKIGKNCTIGANAVVLQDVPDNATAVGIPARIILKPNPLQISATVDQEAD
ncbi:serine O-acetyltransferase [Ancylobacter sp. A5.8]|uniref:serine O-acetyltransferase EpsC n=1 Tax=Ancylobacter gelatini TaxID=2919920 RepID=UPI001F4EE1A6|nr:serine O-acetyltransferase EpsC [Ancylobacter gelatini]MCJ8142584.1 serine O-acetyltransferase [Ancylobacter gelatini]